MGYKMDELERLADRIRRALHGEAWHGASLEEVLLDLSPEQAASYPIDGAHSIWEIVLHLTCWHRVVKRRYRGETFEPTDEEDWPSIPVVSAAAWEAAREVLFQSGEELIVALDTARTSDLDLPVPGKSFPLGFMLQGVVEHDLYHGGQIAILIKRL
jgi:uncharacterized damage-inducible protein DinB